MTSPVDIRPDQLEIVQDILLKHLPADVKVWVFGSRANWTTKDSSDLDLALEGESKLSHNVLGALKDAFKDSALPYTVDVVDLNRIGDSFRQIVESQRVHLPVEGVTTNKVPLAGSNGQRSEVKLGDVATIVMGQSPPGSTVSDEPGVALLNGPTEFGPHHPVPVQFTSDPRKFAQPGDVLFCVRGSTTGRMNWADQEYAIGRGVAAIRHTEDPALQPLLRGAIEVALPELLITATGSTFPNVSASQIADIPYPDLDVGDQRAVAHILGTLDDKIELNRRMNETLEAMARALFKSWFVDFEPVRAKMEGRWHPGESLPGLPAEHYDLFPDRLVDSEIGEIPEGWEVKRIDEIAERVAMGPFGSSIKVATFVNNGIPVISGQHLGGTLLEDNEYNYITEAHADKLANANVKRGDIVFTHAGSIGQAAYIPPSSRFERYVISQRQFYMRCDTSKISPLFVVHYFKTWEGQHQLLANTSSTGVPSIARPVTYLRSIELCVPPEITWRKFDKIAGAFHSNIACNTEESRCLATQRDALLPGLVSGEVEVYTLPNNAGSAS